MQQSRVNEIDLLRFLAALSVVFFHYAFRGYAADHLSIMPYPLLAPFAQYAYLGVELFFMISGFVILMTAMYSSPIQFLISRSTRLYPAFWIACSLTFITTLLIGAPVFNATWLQYLGNLTMLSEFLGLSPIDGAYWSLFVEIRFYFLVLVLLLFRKLQYTETALILWLLISFLLELFPIASLRYLLLTEYAAFFIAGAVCFLIWLESISLTKTLILLTAWCLATYETLSALPSLEEHYHTAFIKSWVVGLISIFFLIMLLVAQRKTGIFGKQRWLVLGAMTYPLYLIHQHIGYMLFNKLYPHFNEHVLFWGVLVLMLLLAYAIYYFLERRLASYLRATLKKLLHQS